jgi:hypothetical protein
MVPSYFEKLRHAGRTGHNNAPPSFHQTQYVQQRWRPFTEHLTTPPGFTDICAMSRAIPTGSVQVYGQFALTWRAVEVCVSVVLARERIPGTFRRRSSHEMSLFWVMSPDGASDHFVVLSATYTNEVRPSERFSMGGYTAKPKGTVLLKQAEDIELGVLCDKHDWFERIEWFFRDELEAIAAHHRRALQQAEAALYFMDRQIAA